MSPLMFESIVKNDDQIIYDPFKSDIFSLGLIILEIGTN